MMTEIAAVMTSLKAAGDITKAALGLGTAEAIRDQVIDLQGIILSAQSSAMSAQLDQMALLEKIREAEKQIADLKAWEREKLRYALAEANPGRGSVLVYVLKPDAEGSEPAHATCANCYQDGKKSILQATPEVRMRLRVHVCHRCDAEYAYSLQPEIRPVPASTDFDVFRET